MIRAGSPVPGPLRRATATAATRATRTAAVSSSGSSRRCPASGARSTARTNALSRTFAVPMLPGTETSCSDPVERAGPSRGAGGDDDAAVVGAVTGFGFTTVVSSAGRRWAAGIGGVTATGSTWGVRPGAKDLGVATASGLGPAIRAAAGTSTGATTGALGAAAIGMRVSTAGADSTCVSTGGADTASGSDGTAGATGATGTSAGVTASVGSGAGCGSGTSGVGAETGCGTGMGSKPSGSTYPSGSAATRTPRWTCGAEVTASALSPTTPTTVPSATTLPRRTLVEPSCSNVTA